MISAISPSVWQPAFVKLKIFKYCQNSDSSMFIFPSVAVWKHADRCAGAGAIPASARHPTDVSATLVMLDQTVRQNATATNTAIAAVWSNETYVSIVSITRPWVSPVLSKFFFVKPKHALSALDFDVNLYNYHVIDSLDIECLLMIIFIHSICSNNSS